MAPPKKKKEPEPEPVVLPKCPPKPDICLETGLTPAENAACYEKARQTSPVSRSVKKFYSFVAPAKEKCRLRPPPPAEDECPPDDDDDDS